MYLKIFLPFLLFLIFQLINFYFYEGFNLDPGLGTQILITGMYISVILSIIIFCTVENKKNKFYINETNSSVYLDYFMLLLALIFLIKPAIILFGIGYEMGFGYLRANYYTDPSIQKIAYGSNLNVAITNYYINPVLWLYVIFLSNSIIKRKIIIFYLILIILIIFNLSYGGRFNLYYGILIMYFKVILEGKNFYRSIKKYGYIVLIFFLVSIWMLVERNINNQHVLDSMWLGLYEYHNLPTFLLAQKIENNDVSFDGFPFKTIIYSIMSPFFVIFGLSGDSVPYFYYAPILGKFTLYSFYTENFYNSYATFFIYYYIDNGFFAPLIIFINLIILFFYSNIIPNKDVRNKYLCFICFTLYNSLFMAPFFNPGYAIILFLFPLLYFIYSKIRFKL